MLAILVNIVISVVLAFLAMVLMRPKIPSSGIKPTSFDDFKVPTAQEGRPIPVLFGRRWISGENIVWYGDYSTRKRTKKVKSGKSLFGKTKYTKTTVGYEYYMGMHMVLCSSNGDTVLTAIAVGEKSAWTGNAGYNGRVENVTIDKTELFGGQSGEGGIKGTLTVCPGLPTQGQDSYLVNHLGSNVPAFRGVFSVILKSFLVCYMTAYPKTWAFLATRYKTDDEWINGQANIQQDRNPIHIIYECLTNQYWGLGFNPSDLDLSSFSRAAAYMYNYEYGLSCTWSSQNDIETFLNELLEIIDGVVFQHPRTGKWIVRLLRASDQNTQVMKTFDTSNITSLESFARNSWTDIVNTVILNYVRIDSTKESEKSITVYNSANFSIQGCQVGITKNFNMITRDDVAGQVATRVLRQYGSLLANVILRGKRNMSDLVPGDLFKFSWAPLGIDNMIMRVLTVDYGELTDGTVKVSAIEDMFAQSQTSITGAPDSEWTDPSSPPVPASIRRFIDKPYWHARNDVGFYPSDVAVIENTAEPLALIVRPVSDALGYFLVSRAGTGTAESSDSTLYFTPAALTVSALNYTATSIQLTGLTGMPDFTDGQILALIDDEIVGVVTSDNLTYTLVRGLLDTVPTPHAAGSVLFFISETDFGEPDWLFPLSPGQVVRSKALVQTSQGTLADSSAPEDTITLRNRFRNPYPPGTLSLNGVYLPDTVYDELTSISWRERNRNNVDAFYPQSGAAVAAEDGTTYTLQLYGDNGRLLRTWANITDTSVVYTKEMETVDSGYPLATGFIEDWSTKSQQTPGTAPNGWPKTYSQSNNWLVSAGAAGGVEFQSSTATSTSGMAIYWEEQGTTNADMEATTCMNVSASATTGAVAFQAGLGLRLNVASSAGARLFVLGFGSGLTKNISIYRFSGTTQYILDTQEFAWDESKYYYMRFRATNSGSTTTVEGKVWEEGTTEPTAWMLTASYSSSQYTTGGVGLYVRNQVSGALYSFKTVGFTIDPVNSPAPLNLSEDPGGSYYYNDVLRVTLKSTRDSLDSYTAWDFTCNRSHP